jgi:hypothetical protein
MISYLTGKVQAPLDLAQHERAAVRRQRAAIETGVEFMSFDGRQAGEKQAIFLRGGLGFSLVPYGIASTPNSHAISIA